jgi:hypothetical protein
MLRKLQGPSCVQVAENHKNLVREGRKFGGGGGIVSHFYGREAILTYRVTIPLRNIGFYRPRAAFRQLRINCRGYII